MRSTDNAERMRLKRREYDRKYKSGAPSRIKVDNCRLPIPDNIERREVHAPCFRCESRGPCRHRPWMLAS